MQRCKLARSLVMYVQRINPSILFTCNKNVYFQLLFFIPLIMYLYVLASNSFMFILVESYLNEIFVKVFLFFVCNIIEFC